MWRIVRPFFSKNASVPFEVCAGTLSCKRVTEPRVRLLHVVFDFFFISNRRYSFNVIVLLWGIGTWTVSPRLLKKIEDMSFFILVYVLQWMVFLHFWLPIFCCYTFSWASRSDLCFIDCPNIRKCPLIELRIFLKHFYGQSKHDLSFGHPAVNGEFT